MNLRDPIFCSQGENSKAIRSVLQGSTQGSVHRILRALPYLDQHQTIFIKEGLENLEYV